VNNRRFPQLPSRPWRIGIYAALLAVLLGLNYWGAHRVIQVTRIRVPYSPFFLQQVRADNVSSITSSGAEIQGDFVHPTTPAHAASGSAHFVTEIPAFADTNQLSRLLEAHGVVVNAKAPDNGGPLWERLLFGFGPTIVLLLLLFWVFRRMSGSRTAGAMGRARAQRYEPGRETITFADVAGIDEAKQELSEIVDFLRDPEKYRRLGGRIPRGVLLSGPPGTGKTLLARAVAGEAGAPFFSMSASEFVEAIVGVGASRVRDLFRQAKKESPAIVFIDELDAVGRARSSAGGFGGSDEREQTLNQILTEMDGFGSATNVIVLGATNRIDVLDKALLRPGRFDRRVVVQAPDREGRRLILEVHTEDVPLAPDVDLRRIAATTPGMVGADLANLVNEAALLAARLGRTEVTSSDFAQSLEKILLGAERKIMVTPEDRRNTAYHEAGHALVGMLTPGADPVRKISIVPRGQALGVTISAPETDRFNHSRAELEALVKVALGGRAAEELVFGVQTTGAEGDIAQVTALVRHMVGRWGMSETIGLMAVLPPDGVNPWSDLRSSRTLELVDEEVRRTIETAYDEVRALLAAERARLDTLAEALLEHETLDQIDAYRIAGLSEPEPLPID
jgi:cell division protease FtsH